MILGYTLTTFPKGHKTLMHNQSNRDLWHNCKRNKRNQRQTNNKLHLNASRRTLQKHKAPVAARCTLMVAIAVHELKWNQTKVKTVE